MADIIQIRRDTAANWTSANPTLAQGELGVELDTSKIKVGDGSTAWTSLGYLINTTDYATYSDATANFTGTLQNGGSNVVVDSDIGSTVQAYDADTAKYDDTTANFTGTLQNGGSNVVVDSDIGSTVQAYDADTAKYDDTTANFTGTLQNGGSNVVVDSDIGSTVQAYDADTAKTDVAQTFSAQQTFGELKETVYTLGTSGTVALDPANGSIQSSATSGAITFTDSLEAGQTLVLMITGGDSNTITWPTTTWVTSGGNVAPTSTASDTFVFWKVSTTLYAAYVGSYV